MKRLGGKWILFFDKRKARTVILCLLSTALLILYFTYVHKLIQQKETPPELEMECDDFEYTNKYGEIYIFQKSFFVNMPEGIRAEYNRYNVYLNDGNLIFSCQGGNPRVNDIFTIGKTSDLNPICYLIMTSGEEYIVWRKNNFDEDLQNDANPAYLPIYLYDKRDSMIDFLSEGDYTDVFKYLSDNHKMVKEKIEDMGYSSIVYENFFELYVDS